MKTINLAAHKKKRHKVKEGTDCSECGKNVLNPRRHRLIHTGETGETLQVPPLSQVSRGTYQASQI